MHSPPRPNPPVPDAELTDEQRRILTIFRENHTAITEAFGAALDSLGIPERVGDEIVLRQFSVMTRDAYDRLPPEPDNLGEVCCMSCQDDTVCCNDQQCFGCCGPTG